MNNEFLELLGKAQALQRMYVGNGMFSVSVKWDSYYENYIELDYRCDDKRLFMSTLTCVRSGEAEERLRTFKEKIDELQESIVP